MKRRHELVRAPLYPEGCSYGPNVVEDPIERSPSRHDDPKSERPNPLEGGPVGPVPGGDDEVGGESDDPLQVGCKAADPRFSRGSRELHRQVRHRDDAVTFPQCEEDLRRRGGDRNDLPRGAALIGSDSRAGPQKRQCEDERSSGCKEERSSSHCLFWGPARLSEPIRAAPRGRSLRSPPRRRRSSSHWGKVTASSRCRTWRWSSLEPREKRGSAALHPTWRGSSLSPPTSSSPPGTGPTGPPSSGFGRSDFGSS